MSTGPPIVYFHGMPGSPRELALFGGAGMVGQPTGRVFAPDRTAGGCGSSAGLDALAADIAARYPNGDIHLIAFSLGTRVALEVAVRLGPLVGAIDLVSPAAPLETGDYAGVAGAPVFALAARSPRLFALFVDAQSIAARRVPALLYRGLFASAGGTDRALAARPAFAATMRMVLTDCLAPGAAGYRAELRAFAAPWAPLLARIGQPITLWHGAADTWAPSGMTEALHARLPNVVAVHRFDGLGHYATLEVALRALCR